MEKKNASFSLGNIVATSRIQKITSGGSDNKITLDDPFDFSPSKRYAIRRKLKKAISNAAPLEFGNNILTSDVQNVYNEADENMYVASGSLPSHIISRNLSVIGI